ncbi:CAP domain-containing protein [Aspergillus karnatakaensis]|uniref:putative extracellular SCP domain protein Pry1 n=1 Tax=Aspergillus karnatakaensis TaxID=1810916 RepID=UPI003CCE1CDC
MRRIPGTTHIALLLSTLLLSRPACASEKTVVVTITATATATATTTAAETKFPDVPQDTSYTSSNVFKSSILDTSNIYRTAHKASELTWNNTLATYAKEWAETCAWKHSHGPYGENLAYGYANATAAVRAWGDEVHMYDFDKPTGFTKATGHFTQLVWKGTRQVGCAAVDCGVTDWDPDDGDGEDEEEKRAQGWYVVCEYVPGGNMVGGEDDKNRWFRENVLEAEEEEYGLGDDDEHEDEDGEDDEDGGGDENGDMHEGDDHENASGDEAETGHEVDDDEIPEHWAWIFNGQGSERSIDFGMEGIIWWVATVCIISSI